MASEGSNEVRIRDGLGEGTEAEALVAGKPVLGGIWRPVLMESSFPFSHPFLFYVGVPILLWSSLLSSIPDTPNARGRAQAQDSACLR